MSDNNPDFQPKPPKEKKYFSVVKMTAPWEGFARIPNTCSSEADPSVIVAFIRRRSRTHEIHIREHEKTKRVGLILSAFLILSSALIVLFAPEGREMMSYWIGAALIVTAAGAAGYKRVWAKSKVIETGADQGGAATPGRE